MSEVKKIRGLVWREPDGPTTVEDVAILTTNEWDETYGVLADDTCVVKRKYLDSCFKPEPHKRNQPFLIDPRTV